MTRLIAYASRTGTKKNLEGLRRAGWRLLCSATGVLRAEGFRYALDNGAWTAHQRGEAFNSGKFYKAVELLGEGADWIVLPDIVEGGLESLRFSLSHLCRVSNKNSSVLLPVQDGMEVSDVAPIVGGETGIFIGGSTSWKEETLPLWSDLARVKRCICHVGRVNSMRRISLCQQAGATSFDGSGPSRFSKMLPRLQRQLNQPPLPFMRGVR